MSAIYTVDQTLQVNDYYSKVIKAKAQKNVIQSILKRGETPANWEQKIEVEPGTEAFSVGAAEGTDFNEAGIAKRTNLMLSVQLEKFRSTRGFRVTDEAQLLPGYTEKKGEKQLARQQRRDAEELAYSIDCILGSSQEAVERGTSDATVAKTRGLMCWLQKGGVHTVHPIPGGVRPTVGFTGTVSAAGFTEAQFKELLTLAAIEQGDEHLSLTGLVGQRLKMLMSDWLGKATTVTGMENILRRTEPKARKIELICDEFAYDGVSVRTLVCNHLGCTIPASGAITRGEAQLYSGAFIRPEFWSIDTLMPMRKRMLENKGGGERGYHEAILRLACRNPLGQFAVVHTPAASGT